MSKLRFLIAAAAASLLTTPLMAQVGSLSDGSLMDNQASAAQPAAEEVVRETIGAWNVECAATGPEPRPCRMSQLLKDAQGGPVAEVSMYRLPEGGVAVAGATFVVPLQTLLPQQLTISVDGVLANRIPYTVCNQVGCIARLALSAIETEAYLNSKEVSIALVPAVAPDQVISVSVSMEGVREAFEKSGPVAQ